MRRWRRRCTLYHLFSGGRFATKMHCFLCSVCAGFFAVFVLTANFLSTSSIPNNVAKERVYLGPSDNISAHILATDGDSNGPLVRQLDNLPSRQTQAVTSDPENNVIPATPSRKAESIPHRLDQAVHFTSAFEAEVYTAFPEKGFRSGDLRKIAHKCGAKNVRKPVNFDGAPFLINEPDFCSGQIFLIVAIHTNGPNFQRRDLIRKTWASMRQIGDRRITVLFFLGNSVDPGIQEAVEKESRQYRDIIQRDFVENYRNMTRKHLTIMRWVATHCSHAQFLLKVDDDTFVDVFHVVHFLELHPPQKFICKKISGKPIRNARNNMRKWIVTKAEYPGAKYPWYCEGFAYLMDVSVAKQLYWCSVYTDFFWIDDVYVSGVLRDKLGVDLEAFWNGHSWANVVPSFASDKMMDTMFLVASHNEVMPELWWRIWKAVIRFSFAF